VAKMATAATEESRAALVCRRTRSKRRGSIAEPVLEKPPYAPVGSDAMGHKYFLCPAHLEAILDLKSTIPRMS
jgi:hypothetical protein